MAKKKELLFQLIKSLTKEEKRHFKLYVSRYNTARENNYLKLFSAIEKQEVYDEAAIKEQFRKEAFVKQLTVTKHYLQKQIIKSLQILHYDTTVEFSMLALHHQIAVLYAKGQYEICRDLVKKGIEVCSENELFLEWIGFLKWEIDLANMVDLANYKLSVANYLEKTSQLLTWYEITAQGNHLANQLQIFSLDTPTFGSHSQQYNVLINRIENLIKSIHVESLPLKTRYNLYFPLAQSYLAIADYDKAFRQYLSLYHELKAGYQSMELHEQYIKTLLGMIYACIAVNQHDIVRTALKELKDIPEINPHISYIKAESLAFFPLISCALSGDFYNGLIAVEIIESFLQDYSDKITPAQYFYAYYYAAYIYLGHGNNAHALKYLRKIDEYQLKDLLPNLKLAMKIMEIIIFYDQRKVDLMESRIRSLQRQVQKEVNVKAFMLKFVTYFQKLAVLEPGSKTSNDLIKRFIRELRSQNIKDQQLMFIHFDIISWLESKIEQCTFGAKIQVNAGKIFGNPA